MPVLGQSIPHDSARTHVSGASLFIDDHPPQRGELYLEVFGSPVAHGMIKALDLDAARAAPESCASSPPLMCRGKTSLAQSFTTIICSQRTRSRTSATNCFDRRHVALRRARGQETNQGHNRPAAANL